MGGFVFQQFVVCCFSILYFGFWFWVSTTEHMFWGWAYRKKTVKKTIVLKKKIKKANSI